MLSSVSLNAMIRKARLCILLFLFASWTSSAFADELEECRFEQRPLNLERDGKVVIQALSTELAGDLLSRGYAFPPKGIIPGISCPGLVLAILIFNVPRVEVIGLLEQTHRQGEYLRNVHRVHSVMRAEGESIVQYDLKILFTKLSYQLHYYSDRDQERITWALESNFDNDLREVRGYWEFLSFEDDRTLAIYGTIIDIGPMLPKRTQAALTRKSLRQSISDIYDWVQTQGNEPQ